MAPLMDPLHILIHALMFHVRRMFFLKILAGGEDSCYGFQA